ncbi:DUF6527 family protein [Burkholderia seminalis]|uniref:DUF6527 family protein n=1 Tax=Burkholderia seminalis TaxID=488731 RepID=UPI00299E75AD|nr:DUF6527 family protein [Burkholderia seminalis]
MEYGTVLHRCCCGCGEEVVTPLTPTDWKLTFDGIGISLSPSVGNWNLPCRSHYVISRNAVLEAGPWTRQMVNAEVQRDKAAKALHYGHDANAPSDAAYAPVDTASPVQSISGRTKEQSSVRRVIARIARWLSG